MIVYILKNKSSYALARQPGAPGQRGEGVESDDRRCCLASYTTDGSGVLRATITSALHGLPIELNYYNALPQLLNSSPMIEEGLGEGADGGRKAEVHTILKDIIPNAC